MPPTSGRCDEYVALERPACPSLPVKHDAVGPGRPVRHRIASAMRHQPQTFPVRGDGPNVAHVLVALGAAERHRQPAGCAPGGLHDCAIAQERAPAVSRRATVQSSLGVWWPDPEYGRTPVELTEGQPCARGGEGGKLLDLVRGCAPDESAPASVGAHHIDPVRRAWIATVLVYVRNQAAGRRERRGLVCPGPPASAAAAGNVGERPRPAGPWSSGPDRPRAALARGLTVERWALPREGDQSVPARKRRLRSGRARSRANRREGERRTSMPTQEPTSGAAVTSRSQAWVQSSTTPLSSSAARLAATPRVSSSHPIDASYRCIPAGYPPAAAVTVGDLPSESASGGLAERLSRPGEDQRQESGRPALSRRTTSTSQSPITCSAK
jgi:hypothetical protein